MNENILGNLELVDKDAVCGAELITYFPGGDATKSPWDVETKDKVVRGQMVGIALKGHRLLQQTSCERDTQDEVGSPWFGRYIYMLVDSWTTIDTVDSSH